MARLRIEIGMCQIIYISLFLLNYVGFVIVYLDCIVTNNSW